MDNIKIKKDDKKDAQGYVWFNLHKYNQKNCEYISKNSSYAHNDEINGDFIIYDNDNVIGGALGTIIFGWYHLTDFCINEQYRNKGLGSKVIKKIEEFAKENNALGVKIDSWNFQAPKFYQKLGYTVWGEFKDCPPGTVHYYLYKKF